MGDPNAYGRSTEERFWAKVDRSGGPEACWPWLGGRQATGYGRMTIDQQDEGAHRYSLSLKLGRPLGEGMAACHTCDNPPCCNPAHLFEATTARNVADMRAKGRGNVGERHGHARLTEAQVREIRRLADGGRAHSAIAEQLGLKRRQVSRVASRMQWRHI